MRFCTALLTLALPVALLSSLAADSVPDDLEMTRFAGPEITPSPACLCVSAQGEVFAGVDLNGSLGKGPGRGRIVRLVDENQDGIADSHTTFAEIDNPRGLVSIGTKLWVLHTAFGDDGKATGMDLVVLEDADRDGVADGPANLLIEGICSADAVNNRGTDHSTNGIQIGIDGWIYIAIGDFGFADAEGTDGTKLTLLGGGIVRVRPDGSEMELYTTGMRNIYDVAIDPYMNIFTRGNTNDGGGWNVRFNHHIQSGEYGYPRLFINFADEIIPALEDVGGGSGVGAFFLSEPTWPEKYNNQPLMADWGRKHVYLHRLSVDGPTFLQTPEDFIGVSQVTDLDVDPTGQMFLSAWDGAGFKGNESKGYLVRATPKNWKPAAFPDLTKLDDKALVALLKSPSASTRLHAQQAALQRQGLEDSLTSLVKDGSLPLANRVAALYTLAQLDVTPASLLGFAEEESLTEFALRAATDRLPRNAKADLPLEPFVAALRSGTPRQRAAAAIALGRLGNPEGARALLEVAYRKPEPEGAPVATPMATLKKTRSAKVKLQVRPGQSLYLSLKETNPVDSPSHFMLSEPTFVTADNKRVRLDASTPLEGKVFVDQHPDGSKFSGKKAPKHFFTAEAGNVIVFQVPDQAVRFEASAMAAKSNPEGSIDFIASTVPPEEAAKAKSGPTTPRHATPNPDVVLPHLAVRSLVKLGAVKPCLDALNGDSKDLALWALSYLHESSTVEGLLEELDSTQDASNRREILTTLARLYHQEAPFEGDWWWSTRPDTRGPYYKPITWDASPKIEAALLAQVGQMDKAFLADLNDRLRLGLEKLGTNLIASEMEEQPTVDLAKIAAKQGAVGTTPIEDTILSLDKLKGDVKKGEKLFTTQGCIACHALKDGGPALGPYMGQIGSIMNREQIATAILRPNDTISQGFQTAMITLKDGATHMGFVTASNTDSITLRDMTGKVTKIDAKQVKEEKHLPQSMMPPGLANALSLEQFADLVNFLASKKQ